MMRVCIWEWGVKTKHSKVLQALRHAGEGRKGHPFVLPKNGADHSDKANEWG
jgi:hypothetical protein